MKKLLLLLICVWLMPSNVIKAQGSPDYNGGYKIKFDESGKKYFRIISWAQVQGVYSDAAAADVSPIRLNLRRARILTFAQITDKFLILTHFGLNSLNASNMSPTGKGEASQLFWHDFWAQYSVGKKHAIGGGLHYWNGISRLNNQSTLNIMTLDNNRQSWATIGLSDQFARHLGIYAKGSFGKLQYRVSINDALVNTLDGRDPLEATGAVYAGKQVFGSRTAGYAYAGYFDYNFLDQESNFLPFKVGSYIGGKKIFNIGAGFFYHPNGVAMSNYGAAPVAEDVMIFAVDAFYDAPLGDNGSAITAYATFQSNNYGTDYMYSAYGTGTMVYGHVGYVLPVKVGTTKFQPYVSFGNNQYDGSPDDRNILGIGANAYLSGHNSKLTLEYRRTQFGSSQTGTVTLQAMVYL